MESKDYAGYIAFFWKNNASLIPKTDFVDFLKSQLGSSMFNAPLPKIRETSRMLYKAYVISVYARYSAFHIASNIESKDMGAYLSDTMALNKKYGVYYDIIDYDFSNAGIDAFIKKNALPNYKAVISDLLDEDVKPRPAIKKSPKVKKSKISPKVKPKIQPKVKKSKISSKVKPKLSPKVKTKSKVITKAGMKAAKVKKPVKSCADYKIPELKTMANLLKIQGYNRMNKQGLCEALGI